jgi:cell division septation protein DedD
VADGGLIGASDQPYKQAPANPGGKQFEGTGDPASPRRRARIIPPSSPPAMARPSPPRRSKRPRLTPNPRPSLPPPPPAAAAEDAGPAGGVVQIAAYSNEAQARSGWDHLVQQHEMLKGMNHRIVQGQSDIGTVFRLQLLASAGGGSACAGS